MKEPRITSGDLTFNKLYGNFFFFLYSSEVWFFWVSVIKYSYLLFVVFSFYVFLIGYLKINLKALNFT